MAVVRLPSIHMNSGFSSSSGFPGDESRSPLPYDRQDPRYPHRIMPSREADQAMATRSPKLTLKRAHFLPYEDDVASSAAKEPMQEQRVYAHGFDAVLSPSQRKRRRGDSDMSMSGRPSDSTSPYGSVQITSASIRALIHNDESGDHRRSVVYEDSDFGGRASWAASSSRDSGRDSDLWDAATSPRDLSEDAAGADPSRPVITNASRNITFDMLQVHFSKPLKDAANYFGVCTTLLKKICRKNGIVSWPYRQIIGLQKSIASMEQQVHYFDGEQRRQYADQLQKLHIKLEAYIRTGEAPSDDELAATLRATRSEPASHSAPAAAAAPQTYPQPTSYHPQSVMASALTLDAAEPQQRYETYSWASTTTSQSSYDHRQNVQIKQDYAAPAQYSPTPLPSIASILKQQSSPNSQQHTSYAEPRGDDYPRW